MKTLIIADFFGNEVAILNSLNIKPIHMKQKEAPDKFISGGRKFSRSNQHKDMWIVEDGLNAKGVMMFHVMYCSDTEIVAMFPPDREKRKVVVLPPRSHPFKRA